MFRDLCREVAGVLAPSGIVNAEREAELLIAAVSGRSLGDLQLDQLLGRSIAADDCRRIRLATARRARREPLQHITGTAPFMDFELAVGPGVFVPRPETELLVAFATGELADATGTVIDIGAGSGTIAIGIARACPNVEVVALEASPLAWPWLRRNVRELAPNVDTRFGDWVQQVPEGPLAAICSNPPYVPSTAIPQDPEVRCFDPEMALYSGADGLDEIRRIAAVAAAQLRSDGFVVVEHTEDQGEAIRACFSGAGLKRATTISDLTDRPRLTVAWQG